MAKSRTVEFSVRAKDEFSKVLNDLEKQQQKMSASAKAANRRNLLSVASEDIKATADSYKRLSADIDRYKIAQDGLVAAGKRNSSEMRELNETIAITRQRARDSVQALQAKRAALNQITGASQSGFLAFNRIAMSMEKSSAAATAESAAVASTAAQLNKLTNSSNTATTAQSRLKAQLNSTTAAVQKQRVGAGARNAKGESQDIEIYGLRPYQMTNLGYQLNDVISGLAMGQRPMQVFAQQAGQIAQIWPNTMVALVRSIPQLLAFGAAAGPFIAVALRMRAAGENLRYFQEQLAFMSNGGDYNARNLADMATGFSEIGIAADDARKIIAKLASQGLGTGRIKEITTLAQGLSKFTGKTVIEEADRLSEAFGGNGKEIVKLDEELNFLTASQLDAVNAMIRNKDAAGAAALAQEALAAKIKAAKTEGGSWADAMTSMGKAWDALVDVANRTGVVQFLAKEWDKFGKEVGQAADSVADLANKLKNLSNPDYAELTRQIEALEKLGNNSTGLPYSSGNDVIDGLNTDRANSYSDTMAKLVEQRRELVRLAKDEGLLAGESEASVAARQKYESQIKEVIAEKLANLREEKRLLELNVRERYVEQQVLDARNKALEEANRLGRAFLGLTKEQTAEIREQANALFDQQRYNDITGNSANVVDKIIGVESRGKANAKNPTPGATATGLGQFIEETWLRMFKQYFPDRAKGMTDAAILALRTNADLSRQMVELYLRENADALKKAGHEISDATLYLGHFLGAGGANKLLKAYKENPNTPIENVVTPLQQKMNPTVLGAGKTVGDVYNWSVQKMGISDPEVQAAKTLNELDEKRLKTEQDYTKERAKRIADQQFELTLVGKGLRDAAIAKAIRDEELKAKEAGLTLTKEQRAETERLAAAEFDNKNVNIEVNRLMEQRKALFETLQIAQAAGDTGKAQETIEQIGQVEAQLQSAIDKAIAFWRAIGGEGAEAAILSLQNISATIGKTVSDLQTKFLPTAEDINTQLADIGSNAFSSFAQAIANGENAAQAFFNSLLQGLADFLIEIGKAIVKQALFNALTGGQSSGGGIGGMLAGSIGGLFGAKHTGGIIGQPGMMRFVNPAVFAGAAKHHTGGVIGQLGSNEVPIIGLRGEEVLTTDDPRHRANGGGGAVNIKTVNVIDPVEMLAAALQSVEGERVFFNFFTRNSTKAGAVTNG